VEQFTNLSPCRLIITLLAKLDQQQQVFQFSVAVIPSGDNFLQRGPFFENFLRRVPLIPETGARYFRFEFGDPFFLRLNVKDTPSAQRACLVNPSVFLSLRETSINLIKLKWRGL